MTQMTTCDLHNETIIRLQRELAAANARAEQNEKDAGRYRWILKRAQITDFIFRGLNSKERHVSNAIDAAIAAKEKPNG